MRLDWSLYRSTRYELHWARIVSRDLWRRGGLLLDGLEFLSWCGVMGICSGDYDQSNGTADQNQCRRSYWCYYNREFCNWCGSHQSLSAFQSQLRCGIVWEYSGSIAG